MTSSVICESVKGTDDTHLICIVRLCKSWINSTFKRFLQTYLSLVHISRAARLFVLCAQCGAPTMGWKEGSGTYIFLLVTGCGNRKHSQALARTLPRSDPELSSCCWLQLGPFLHTGLQPVWHFFTSRLAWPLSTLSPPTPPLPTSPSQRDKVCPRGCLPKGQGHTAGGTAGTRIQNPRALPPTTECSSPALDIDHALFFCSYFLCTSTGLIFFGSSLFFSLHVKRQFRGCLPIGQRWLNTKSGDFGSQETLHCHLRAAKLYLNGKVICRCTE